MVDFPSPAGVGLIPATRISLPRGGASVWEMSSGILAL